MKKVKNWWKVLLLGAVLMATLVGVVGARPSDRAQAGTISRRVTIPAGAFTPSDGDYDYWNGGDEMWSLDSVLQPYFNAHVELPTGQAVVVESVTLYAYDENGTYDVCAWLTKTDPTAGAQEGMAYVCSTGSSSNDPRNFTDGSINNNPVKHGRGLILELQIEDDSNLTFYGVRIQYHHGTT
jgi:hypothetical protein